MKISNKLLDRLINEAPFGNELSENTILKRTRAGRHQFAAGTWSWYIDDPLIQAGSCWTMLECLNAKKLYYWHCRGDWHIEVEEQK